MTAAASAPQLPWTFEGVVRLTRIGTTFVIFTVVIGFAALNTGNNALYIALTFLLGTLLLSGIASKGGLKHLTVELTGIDQAWAGRPANAVLRVSNRSRIWNVRDVVIVSNELDRPAVIEMIRRRSEATVHAAFLFRRRGIVELKRVDLYTRYPFAFFLKKRRVAIHGEVVVFPRLLADEGLRERFRPVSGEQSAVLRPGAGSEIHSFREYVRGDSLRQVYWKKSAGIGRWIVKQTEAEAARAVHVVVDPYKPRGASDDDFESMVSETATFVFHALRRGLDVGLTLPRVTLRSNDPEHGSPMFRALALLEPVHEPIHHTLDRNTILFSVRRNDVTAA
jgi:uncharacterized protein (DUF58 family)